MLIDADHRGETNIYPVETYINLKNRCSEELSRIPNVHSIVMCGSVVKGSLVPGWSDLDIVLIMNGYNLNLSDLEKIKKAIELAKNFINIGIGLDVVGYSQFIRDNKFGGRPLAMTIEVAAYGEVVFGKSPFVNDLSPNQFTERLIQEKRIGILAEIHNWRRSYLLRKKDIDYSFLAYTVKTLLKILTFEAGPKTKAPFTYEGALEIIRQVGYPELNHFIQAVTTRANWAGMLERERDLIPTFQQISTAINHYTVK